MIVAESSQAPVGPWLSPPSERPFILPRRAFPNLDLLCFASLCFVHSPIASRLPSQHCVAASHGHQSTRLHSPLAAVATGIHSATHLLARTRSASRLPGPAPLVATQSCRHHHSSTSRLSKPSGELLLPLHLVSTLANAIAPHCSTTVPPPDIVLLSHSLFLSWFHA
jgi:hypothetical protein